jgi:hypothetical protein
MAFARKMMCEAHAVTDEEVRELLDSLGEERCVALVALLAHASFQDRILLVARVPMEPGGPLPPLTIRFARPASGSSHASSASACAGSPPAHPESQALTSLAWTQFQERIDRQRARTARIRVPTREQVLARLGKAHPAAWQADILWSRVCYGFQPELTDAWFACAAAFRQEAALDRLLEQQIFWVVTQSLQCFY